MTNLLKQFIYTLMGLSMLGLSSIPSVFAQTTLPVSVMVFGQHSGQRVIYHYRIVNNSANHVAAIRIGYDKKNASDRNDDVAELRELPPGWNLYDYKLGLPPGVSTSPHGWEAKLYLMEESLTHAIEWGIANNDHQWDIGPSQTLSGISITLNKADDGYVAGHALVLFSDGYPMNLTVPIERIDTIPPTLSVTLSPATLWPPNDKLVPVSATLTVKDDYDPEPEIKLEAITANELLDSGDIGDAQIGADDRSFSMAAKRAGTNQTGRIYTVTYSATDASGNKATVSATVTVAHDQGKK